MTDERREIELRELVDFLFQCRRDFARDHAEWFDLLKHYQSAGDGAAAQYLSSLLSKTCGRMCKVEAKRRFKSVNVRRKRDQRNFDIGQAIAEALAVRPAQSVSAVANRIGISRPALYRHMKQQVGGYESGARYWIERPITTT